MIVWIDGTYCSGKSSIAESIAEKRFFDKTVYLDSDKDYRAMIQTNPYLAFGGTTPQNNQHFIERFRAAIEDAETDSTGIVIVSMALTQPECKKGLLDYLIEKGYRILHIVLTASTETILERIENDEARDKDFARRHLSRNVRFLEQNYSDAIWVSTEDSDIETSAEEVVGIIRDHIDTK